MPRNQKELPADVRFIRKLFGLRKRTVEKNPAQPDKNQVEDKGSERISAHAQAQISGRLGPDTSFRVAVQIQFDAGKLAQQLGLNETDPTIQELAQITIKPVDTKLPDNSQYVGGTDLLSNPQIKINANNQEKKVTDRSDGLVTGI